jgi:serine/threonine-protein kinase
MLAERRRRKWSESQLEGAIVGGRYRIERLLARGGMGAVYAARDEILHRDVAVKVIRDDGDPTLTERLNREACIAARFEHRHVVRIFDLGRTDDDRPYLVMELLQGKLLSDLLAEEGPMSVERTTELLEGVAEALDLVHSQGVVHRDVKPANLMWVAHREGDMRGKLLDFGVSLPIEDDSPRLTVDGAFVGTPLYAAPEVLLGSIPHASGDIYSLAVVAYKLLTGAAPFEQLEMQQMLRAKVYEQPAPPCALRPALPAHLDEVFSRALSPDPSCRPSTAAELIRSLRGLSISRPEPRWKSLAREHVFYAAGGVAFLLAGLVLLISLAAVS